MTSRSFLALSLMGSALLTGGCVTGPDYRAPETAMPDAWHQDLAKGLEAGPCNPRNWWDTLDDATLTRLITLAAEGNIDAQIAAVRVREARLQTAIAAGAYYPTLQGNAQAQSSLPSENAPGAPAKDPAKPGTQLATGVVRSLSSRQLATGIAALPPAALTGPLATPLAGNLVGLVPTPAPDYEADTAEVYAAGFDAAWELDVFGRIRHGVAGARASEEAQIEDYRDTLVSLFGDVAVAYVDYRTIEAQLRVTEENRDLQEKTLTLAQARFNAGLAPRLDITQAQTNLLATQSAIPVLRARLAQTQHRIEVLAGVEPGGLSEILAASHRIPTVPASVAVGVPADLLRQRPDIRAAERRLAAQVARVGVAVADLYPRFSLRGSLGLQSANSGRILDASSLTYTFGPEVLWNIFEGFRNIDAILFEKAVAEEALLAYKKTVLLALEETENAMAAFKQEQYRVAALAQAVMQARESVRLVESLYRNGLTDFQNVLDTQRSLNDLANQLVQSQGTVAAEVVRLYKALGGGWDPALLPHAALMQPEEVRGWDALDFLFSPVTGEDILKPVDFAAPPSPSSR